MSDQVLLDSQKATHQTICIHHSEPCTGVPLRNEQFIRRAIVKDLVQRNHLFPHPMANLRNVSRLPWPIQRLFASDPALLRHCIQWRQMEGCQVHEHKILPA